jgi:D-glycero-D-manno-heptose 1,7-bisphosphate phosphatase
MSNTASPCVFLDRDGVINQEVFYPHTGEWEGPLHPRDLVLCEGVISALKRLQEANLPSILVSNQAAFAKGKVPLEDLTAVHKRLIEILTKENIVFRDYYYSYTHPEGVVPGFSGPSLERKPGAYFLFLSAARHNLDLQRSWMLGDRDTDILCGQNAGAQTILIANPHAGEKAGQTRPHYKAPDLSGAVDIILDKVST